jgi:hypothetical protein
MRQIREVLRLRFASELPQREIPKSSGLSQRAVSDYLSRARAAGVSWPWAEDRDDAPLETLLFPPPPAIAADQRPVPDWAWVHRELRRTNVTLALLWEEHRASAPEGFGYSWSCDLYRGWAGWLKPTMRQTLSPARGCLLTSPAAPSMRRWPHRLDHSGTDFCRRSGRIDLHLRRGGLEPTKNVHLYERSPHPWMLCRSRGLPVGSALPLYREKPEIKKPCSGRRTAGSRRSLCPARRRTVLRPRRPPLGRSARQILVVDQHVQRRRQLTHRVK